MIKDIESAVIINVVPEVISKSIILLENNNLKTIDAIHIASATLWLPDMFVSSDRRQITAAKKAGLKIKFVG